MKFGLLFALCAIVSVAAADDSPTRATEYRELVSRARSGGTFQVTLPEGGGYQFSYRFEAGRPMAGAPLVADFPLSAVGPRAISVFWDRILASGDSYLRVGGEDIPLTCVYVEGQDNRRAETGTPTLPELVLRVYFVANDFSCTGPVNPLWPIFSSRRETWETYLTYEVRDPTIMLPVMPTLVLRDNRYRATWVE